jgi:hypothetical protein
MRNLKQQTIGKVSPATDHWETDVPHAVIRLTPGGASLGALLWTSDGVPYKTATRPDPYRRSRRV